MSTQMPGPWSRFDVRDRVVIVTGGAGLLGASYCRALVEAGAYPVMADVNGQAAANQVDEINRSTGGNAMAIEVDVSNPQAVRAMVDKVLSRWNRIDALINNAAMDPKFDPKHAQEHSSRFEDLSFEDWQQAISVNVSGMFLCAQAVCRPMLQAGKGVIVNVSSTYGLVGPDQRLYEREGQPRQFKPATYTVSKAAALGLTRYLATYFAGQGIRVNTLTPGGVYAGHDEEFVRRYSAKTVLGRMADKNEMTDAVLFLISDASSYMTGANLVVDGGWTAW